MKSKNHDPMTPKEILATWIMGRVMTAIEYSWSKEIEKWAICVDKRAHGPKKKLLGYMMNHYNEPPIPVVIGVVAEAAANHMNVADPSSTLGRLKMHSNGDWIAQVMHGAPQRYLTPEDCEDRRRKNPRKKPKKGVASATTKTSSKSFKSKSLRAKRRSAK